MTSRGEWWAWEVSKEVTTSCGPRAFIYLDAFSYGFGFPRGGDGLELISLSPFVPRRCLAKVFLFPSMLIGILLSAHINAIKSMYVSCESAYLPKPVSPNPLPRNEKFSCFLLWNIFSFALFILKYSYASCLVSYFIVVIRYYYSH